MKRREGWRPVLEAEMKRWLAMSCDQLISALSDVQAYEIEFESKKYQVEVELLENTDSYLHVLVAVDDGHFWRALHPLSSSFICKKVPPLEPEKCNVSLWAERAFRLIHKTLRAVERAVLAVDTVAGSRLLLGLAALVVAPPLFWLAGGIRWLDTKVFPPRRPKGMPENAVWIDAHVALF